MLRIMSGMPDQTEFSLKVTGSSMVPTFLDKQSMAWLKKDAAYTPRAGDVVFFIREDGAFVLHRILKIRKDGKLVMNGDAQTWTEVIDPAQIMARMTHYVQKPDGKDRSADSFYCRNWQWWWRKLRPIHAIWARLYYYWHRIPYKLGIKKDVIETSAE